MEDFFSAFNNVLNAIDGFIWGVPLMVLILFGGILLTVRLRGLQFSKLPRALRYMLKNEKGEDATGEVSSAPVTSSAWRPQSSPAARAPCSGCGLPLCSAWRPNTPRACSR